MKKQKVRKLVGILCILVILCNSGCMGKRETREEKMIDKMIDYMNNKYNDTFTYVESVQLHARISNFGPPYSAEMYLRSAKYPDIEVWACYTIDEAGQETYEENYLSVKYAQQREELLQDIVEEAFPGHNVLVNPRLNLRGTYAGCITEGASDTMSFEEYMAEPTSLITLIAIIEGPHYNIDNEKIEKELEAAITKAGICCKMGDIYLDDGTGQFEKLATGELMRSDYTGYIQKYYFFMDTTKGFSVFKTCEDYHHRN